MPVMLKVGVDNDTRDKNHHDNDTNYDEGFVGSDISLHDMMTRMTLMMRRIMMMLVMMMITTIQIMSIMRTIFVRCLLLGRGSSFLRGELS